MRAVEKAQAAKLIAARAFPNGRQLIWLVSPFDGEHQP
jgi:hypothetical protein